MPCATDPDEILRALDTSETPLTDGRDEAAPPRSCARPSTGASAAPPSSSSTPRAAAAARRRRRISSARRAEPSTSRPSLARRPINDNGPSESFRRASRSRVEIPRAMRRAAGDAVAEVTRCRSNVRRATSSGDDACATPRDTDAGDERRRVQNGRLFFPPDENLHILGRGKKWWSHFASLRRAQLRPRLIPLGLPRPHPRRAPRRLRPRPRPRLDRRRAPPRRRSQTPAHVQSHQIKQYNAVH